MSEILKGHGAPDINRTACLGDYYVDVDTESVYKLVEIKYNTVTRGQNFANATSHDGTYEFIWEAVGGSGMAKFVVTADKDFSALDKTFTEIQDAFNSGAVVELHSVYTVSGKEFTQVYNMSGLVEGQMAQFDAIVATGPNTAAYTTIALSSGNAIQKVTIPFGEDIS